MIYKSIKRTLKVAVDIESMSSISSDDLISMHKDDYQIVRRAATLAALDHIPRYVCGACGSPVFAPRARQTGLPYWKHHAGAPRDCPWWTGQSASVDTISGRQFGGAQESILHKKLK